MKDLTGKTAKKALDKLQHVAKKKNDTMKQVCWVTYGLNISKMRLSVKNNYSCLRVYGTNGVCYLSTFLK
jgi:hypothetical protein